MKALAHFHAISFCYGKLLGFPLSKKYSFLSDFFSNFEHDKDLQEFMDMNMTHVISDLKAHKRDDLLPFVERVSKGIGPKYMKVIKTER